MENNTSVNSLFLSVKKPFVFYIYLNLNQTFIYYVITNDILLQLMLVIFENQIYGEFHDRS